MRYLSKPTRGTRLGMGAVPQLVWGARGKVTDPSRVHAMASTNSRVDAFLLGQDTTMEGARAAEVRPIGPSDPLREPSIRRELASRYLIWDAYVGGARRVDVHPLILPRTLHEGAVRAAEGVMRVVGGTAARAHSDAEERAHYRLHRDVLALSSASHAAGDEAALARVDLLLGEDGAWRACEINADCPGGHNEAFGLPRLARAAGFLGGSNPTRVVEALAARLGELAAGGPVGLLYATAYAEDLQVCALMRRTLAELGIDAQLVSPTAPRLKSGALRVGRTPIRALYRYFPAEYMEEQRNVLDVAQAVRSGAVRTLSSFAQIFAQSKVAFARAWAHAASLSVDDRALLRAHVPETADVGSVGRERLADERQHWVIKRALGRVGDQVYVGTLVPGDDWPPLVDEVFALCARGEAWIAQRFVPQQAIASPWGDRLVTLGAYILDGRFVGYFARVTATSHVSHDALCVPVFVEAS